jgi:hypothetical protein
MSGNARRQETPTNKGQRTSIGANQFASPTFIASTLPARESHYFREFLSETDPDKRDKILDVVSPEMRRALSAQWTAQKARIAVAEGRDPGPVGEGGRQYDDESLAEYEGAKTDLDYANWLRSKEIADFFQNQVLPSCGTTKPPRTRGRSPPVPGTGHVVQGRPFPSPAGREHLIDGREAC